MHPLDALFRPRSVAIVGASGDPNKVGGRPLAFLRRAGYAGRVLPVNPQSPVVQGVAAHASLELACESLGGAPDQVIVALPPAHVMAAVEQAAKLGARAVQIFSAGFGDGAGAQSVQQRLAALARSGGPRILGPNSLGLFNAVDGFFGTFATALDGAWPEAAQAGREGSVAGVGVATQSGAFGSYFFGMAQAQGLRFSHFVATGNEADVDVADCVDFLVDDPATRLIVMALEGCRDGRKLARVLRRAQAAGKPVLAMKVGVSAAGAQAAATHTGSLAGEDRVFDAVLRDCGAWRADSLQALVDAACVASHGPLPRGRRLLVVTTSGGIGVLSADAAEASSLALPPVDDAALGDIRAIAPLADGRNPVDTSAGILGDLSAYARIAERALRSRDYDAVLCYLAHITRNPAHWAQLREPLLAVRARHPQLAFSAVALADASITADLREHGFAVFTDPTAAVRAMAACAPRAQAPHPPVQGTDGCEFPACPALPDGPLDTEQAARDALVAQGIRFAPSHPVRDADAAVAAARETGWPVVLKIVSPDIAHKTEAGGVMLGIGDEAALRAAIATMDARVRQRRPDARLEGFIVARQLSGGVEVLVGTQRDAVFGPVITVGAGGVLAELVGEVSVRLAPVNEAQALEMLRATRIGRLLAGFRGAPAADLDALAAQIATLSRVAWTHRERITGIDLNPVIALPDGAYAADALIATEGEHA